MKYSRNARLLEDHHGAGQSGAVLFFSCLCDKKKKESHCCQSFIWEKKKWNHFNIEKWIHHSDQWIVVKGVRDDRR